MSWLDRQSFLGANSENVLTARRIGIAGLGGGGSHVAQQLAHVGIGSFVLADRDTVEDTNLNRLVGALRKDVRLKTRKIVIAERTIKGIRPGAEVLKIADNWQAGGDLLKTCDVIVGGLDSVRAKDELDAFCRRHLIPYIDMGMDVHGDAGHHLIAGQVVLSSPGTPCLRCLRLVTDKLLEQEAAKYGNAGGNPQVVWPNGVLASTAVGLVMQMLTPWHPMPVESACLEYDGNTATITPGAQHAHLIGRPCPHYPDNERGDPGFDVRNLLSTKSPSSRNRWTRFKALFRLR
jgi:molybdopterin/thiamine biosynthesis adenylyltransferase